LINPHEYGKSQILFLKKCHQFVVVDYEQNMLQSEYLIIKNCEVDIHVN